LYTSAPWAKPIEALINMKAAIAVLNCIVLRIFLLPILKNPKA